RHAIRAAHDRVAGMSAARRSTKTIDKPAENEVVTAAPADEQTALPEGAAEAPSGEDGDEATEEHDRGKWYVIHTYSGYENKVKMNLEHRIDSMGVRDKIYQVIIPTEEEIEIKDGQRRTV